ncbi:hypothetical protein FB639_005509, partial [Coemansia asiatica]
MRTVGTLGALTALLMSTTLARMSPEEIDHSVSQSKNQRQEQCGVFRPGSLEYNKCMAHWTEHVVQSYPENAPLTPQQQSDRDAEMKRASGFRNEVFRLSKPENSHYAIGG